MDFDKSFDRLIGNEGGFTKDPRDRGNWTGGKVGRGDLKGTKFGITAMSYPSLDIERLTSDEARAIYTKDFWGVAGCGQVPDAVKFDLFDFAVNSGPVTAAKLLQRTVGVVEDGAIGPKSIMAISAFNPWELRFKFQAQRMHVMTSDEAAWPTYGRGWMIRLTKNALREIV